jgi:hypothetical protein
MSLSGKGVVAIWNGIREDTRADFFEWHNREHMPERVAIRGFRRGLRFTALDAQPEFFTLYETDDAKTLTGADYLTRLDNPTAWTLRVTAAFLNTSRSLCRVAWSLGPGEGGLMMTFRFEVADGRDGEMMRLLIDGALPKLADRAGIAGAHLCLADRAASEVQTVEKRTRSEKSKRRAARLWPCLSSRDRPRQAASAFGSHPGARGQRKGGTRLSARGSLP